jgi:hypothetical protein
MGGKVILSAERNKIAEIASESYCILCFSLAWVFRAYARLDSLRAVETNFVIFEFKSREFTTSKDEWCTYSSWNTWGEAPRILIEVVSFGLVITESGKVLFHDISSNVNILVLICHFVFVVNVVANNISSQEKDLKYVKKGVFVSSVIIAFTSISVSSLCVANIMLYFRFNY